MKPDRAWVLLGSGTRLNLIDPQPSDWRDVDLAVGLSRTYRWGGHSRWELPLSVALCPKSFFAGGQLLSRSRPEMQAVGIRIARSRAGGGHA